jgi:fumarate reductase subunit C
MSQTTPLYTEYHPRWYRTRVSTWWWLGRWAYLVFILRELSSAFIAWFVVFTLLGVRALHKGTYEYDTWFGDFARHPLVIGLNVVTLFFVVFHAITWFNLAPKAMVIRLRGQRVPPRVIVFSNMLAWALVSGLLAYIILG